MSEPEPPVWMRFPAGHILIHQGETGDRAWIIKEGKLEVLLTNAKGLHRLSTIGPGMVVGEMALIDDGPRTTTVRALTPVVGVELQRDTFARLIKQSSQLAIYLLRSLVGDIRASYDLPPDDPDVLPEEIRSTRSFQKVFERRVYEPGHLVFRQGDPAAMAFLIESGKISVRRYEGENYTERGVFGAGRIIGELALLSAKKRATTAIVVEGATVEVVGRGDFDEAIATMPPALKALTRHYVSQLSADPPI